MRGVNESLPFAPSTWTDALPPTQALQRVASQLGWPKPKNLRYPDRLLLPLLCHTPEWGWGLITDRNAKGEWVVATPMGMHAVSADLMRQKVWRLQLVASVQLGWGLALGGS